MYPLDNSADAKGLASAKAIDDIAIPAVNAAVAANAIVVLLV
jgi:hypothetical protein